MTLKGFFIKEGRLRPTWRVVCYVAAYLLGSFVFQIPIAVAVVAMMALGLVDESQLFELQSSLPLLLAVALTNVALVLPLTYLFRRFLDRGSLLDLGLHRERGWLKEVTGGLLLGVVLIGLLFLAQGAAGWLQVLGFAWQFQPLSLVLANLLGYFAMMTLVAIYEELAFRGYILQNLDADWGAIVALTASSIIFGILHGLNPDFTLLALANIALAGVLLGACYYVTRQLWLPMGLHFAWNFVQGPVLSLPVSGLQTKGLLLIETGGNPMITGGTFGPEGGLLTTIAMSLGLLILWVWRRKQRPIHT
jgi:membrane protease YdiL (CAAX protease family)